MSDELRHALARAQEVGLVGSGSLATHVVHALGFGEAAVGGGWAGASAGMCVDLGTGGGLPGLVLAEAYPETSWLLIDRRERSAEVVARSTQSLGMETRVSVVLGTAEEVARRADARARAGLVVARGFGPPAVTAECAAGFLIEGGFLVVSEPPGSAGDRWIPDGLQAVGLRLSHVYEGRAGRYAVLVQQEGCPPSFPRRPGVPRKRPLWGPLVSRGTSN